MEITWNLITNSEKGFRYERIFGDYERYFNGDWSDVELANIVGSRYWQFNLSIDEIIELFNEMTTSRYSNGFTDNVAFVMFFFKKALYNGRITLEEGKHIWKEFLGSYDKLTIYGRTVHTQVESEWVLGLISYKTTECDKVYKNFIKYLEKLNYEW